MDWLMQPAPTWIVVALFVMLMAEHALLSTWHGLAMRHIETLQTKFDSVSSKLKTSDFNSNEHDRRINKLEARGFWSWIRRIGVRLATWAYEHGGSIRYRQ